MTLSLLTSRTNSGWFIGGNRKMKFGHNMTNSPKSRMTKTSMPGTEGGALTNIGMMWRMAGG